MSISYLFGVEGILLYDVVNEKERESCSEKVSISLCWVKSTPEGAEELLLNLENV